MDIEDNEHKYKAACDRIIVYYNKTCNPDFKLSLEPYDYGHAVIIRHVIGKSPPWQESDVIYCISSYALIFFRLVNSNQIPFLNKATSLEEIELQLQIRGILICLKSV